MSEIISSDSALSVQQQGALKEIVRYMIPADSSRPAASDDAVFAAILVALRPYAAAVGRVLKLYEGMDLADLSRLRNPDLSVLVSAVVQCYYRDERVMRAIEMEPRPPHPQGYEVEQGDFSLLQPVRERGRIYRDDEA